MKFYLSSLLSKLKIRKLFFNFCVLSSFSFVHSAKLIKVYSYSKPIELSFSNETLDKSSILIIEKLKNILFQSPYVYITTKERCNECNNFFFLEKIYISDVDKNLIINTKLIKNNLELEKEYRIKSETDIENIAFIANDIASHFLDYKPMLHGKLLCVFEKENKRSIEIFDRLNFNIETLSHKKLEVYNPIFIPSKNYIVFANKYNGDLQLEIFDYNNSQILLMPKKFNNVLSLRINDKDELFFVNIEKDEMIAYKMNLKNFSYYELFQSKNIITNVIEIHDSIFYWKKNKLYKRKSFFQDEIVKLKTNNAIFEPTFSFDMKYLAFIEKDNNKKHLIIKNMLNNEENIIYSGYEIQSPQWSLNNYEILFTLKDKKRDVKHLKIIDIYGNNILKIKKNYDLQECRFIEKRY